MLSECTLNNRFNSVEATARPNIVQIVSVIVVCRFIVYKSCVKVIHVCALYMFSLTVDTYFYCLPYICLWYIIHHVFQHHNYLCMFQHHDYVYVSAIVDY